MWLLRKIRENRRFGELEDRIEKLERGHRALDAEWSDYYDKLKHILGRVVKRSAIIQKAQQEEAEAGQSSPDQAFSDHYDELTPRQREIQAELLTSRRRQ